MSFIQSSAVLWPRFCRFRLSFSPPCCGSRPAAPGCDKAGRWACRSLQPLLINSSSAASSSSWFSDLVVLIHIRLVFSSFCLYDRKFQFDDSVVFRLWATVMMLYFLFLVAKRLLSEFGLSGNFSTAANVAACHCGVASSNPVDEAILTTSGPLIKGHSTFLNQKCKQYINIFVFKIII